MAIGFNGELPNKYDKLNPNETSGSNQKNLEKVMKSQKLVLQLSFFSLY